MKRCSISIIPIVIFYSGKREDKEQKEGGKKRQIIKEQEQEYLQVLTADICLILLDSWSKAFYLNASKW